MNVHVCCVNSPPSVLKAGHPVFYVCCVSCMGWGGGFSFPSFKFMCSTHVQVRGEYIADFHPDSFAKVGSLMSKYVVLPDIDDLKAKLRKDPSLAKKMKRKGELHFIRNSSEWLVVEQHMVALQGSGNGCNKMGVTYSDFRWQADFCSNKQHRYNQILNKVSVCVSNYMYISHVVVYIIKPIACFGLTRYIQSIDVYNFLSPICLCTYTNIQKRMKRGRAPRNMLFTYGKLHSVTTSRFSWPTGFLRFIADRPRKSLVVLNLAADDLKIVTHKYVLMTSLVIPSCDRMCVSDMEFSRSDCRGVY